MQVYTSNAIHGKRPHGYRLYYRSSGDELAAWAYANRADTIRGGRISTARKDVNDGAARSVGSLTAKDAIRDALEILEGGGIIVRIVAIRDVAPEHRGQFGSTYNHLIAISELAALAA